MSNGIKRIGKGLFAIFMIKLTLVVGVLAFQACQTESNFDNEVHEEAKTNFLAALQESNSKLNEIIVSPSTTKGNDLMKENTGEIATFKMCLLLNQDIDSTSLNTGVVAPTDLITIGGVVDLGNQTGTRPIVVDVDVDDVANDPVAFGFSMCFDIPREPTVNALDPAIIEAKNFFYAQGYNDNDITEMLDGEDESMLVPTVIAIISAENDATSYAQNSDIRLISEALGVTFVNAQDTGDMIGCAMAALGLDIFSELRAAARSGQRIGRALITRTIKSVGRRLLGPIGIFVAVLEFGACLAIAA